MAVRTLKQLRQGVARLLTDRYWTDTADSSGGSTTVLRDAAAKDFPDGYFTGFWLHLTAGADSGTVSYITAFTSASGDFTLSRTLSEAPDGDTYEVTPFHPAHFVDVINDVAAGLYPHVSQQVVDSSFVTGSPLWNGGMEQWASATSAIGWSVSDATLARQNSTLGLGQYMARLTTAATGYLGLTAKQKTDLYVCQGITIRAYALVKASTASDARLRLIDKVGQSDGSYHSGNGEFRLIEVERTMDVNDFNVFDLRIMHDNNSTDLDIEQVWIEGPQVSDYRVPTTMTRGPIDVLTAPIADRDNYRAAPWSPVSFTTNLHENRGADAGRFTISLGRHTGGRAMRFVGREPLTALAADADNAELDVVAAQLLQVAAALRLLTIGIIPSVSTSLDLRNRKFGELTVERNRLFNQARELIGSAHIPWDLV